MCASVVLPTKSRVVVICFGVLDAALLGNGRFAIGRRYAAIGVWCVGFAEVMSLREVVCLRQVESLNTKQ